MPTDPCPSSKRSRAFPFARNHPVRRPGSSAPLQPLSAHDFVTIHRVDCYQVLEALSRAADLAAAVHSFAAQVEAEDAFALVRDRLMPNLPEAR